MKYSFDKKSKELLVTPCKGGTIINKFLVGTAVKATDKLAKPKTRSFKVEVFTRTGWRFLKRQPKCYNPIAIARALLICAGKYPKDIKERAGWDKALGELYHYAEQRG